MSGKWFGPGGTCNCCPECDPRVCDCINNPGVIDAILVIEFEFEQDHFYLCGDQTGARTYGGDFSASIPIQRFCNGGQPSLTHGGVSWMYNKPDFLHVGYFDIFNNWVDDYYDLILDLVPGSIGQRLSGSTDSGSFDYIGEPGGFPAGDICDVSEAGFYASGFNTSDCSDEYGYIKLATVRWRFECA